MNQKLFTRVVSRCLWTGALLCAASLASASTTITFQIDMTVPIQGGLFTPGTQQVAARGSFDGWSSLYNLTNTPQGGNANIYSGNVVDTKDDGNVIDWQFVFYTNPTSPTYSSQADSDNYCLLLPSAGGSVTAPLVSWDDGNPPVTNNVTFQVDMSEQINIGNFNPATESVYLQGNYTGWSDGTPLTNDPSILVTNAQGLVTSNVYVGTYAFQLASNAPSEYKFVYFDGANNNYETPVHGDPDNNNNRFMYNQPGASGTQVLPIVYFSDTPLSKSITNTVTFQIDMSSLTSGGGFLPNQGDYVVIAGGFNGWNNGGNLAGSWELTNNSSAANTNIYTYTAQFVGSPGTQEQYKYVLQPGTDWEQPLGATVSGNRFFYLLSSNGPLVLPPVYFGDVPPGDYISAPTAVTFTVDTTGAVDTSGNPLDPSQGVFINGIPSFQGWDPISLANYQMTNVPGGNLYTITLDLPVNSGNPGGQPLLLTYKYSINGADDEAPSNDNHQRYVRALGAYTMPTDKFGSQGSTTQTEPSFGNLAISSAAGGKVNVTWLGRPGVHLETAASLSEPINWTQQYLTDGTNLTGPFGNMSANLPNAGGNLFIRLIHPGL